MDPRTTPPRAILFDLFGTLVRFRHGPDPAFEWLRAPWEATRLDRPFADFRDALITVTRALVAARPPEYHEVPCVVRFTRALAEVGIDDRAAAEALAAAHMAYIAAQVELPPGHAALLGQLGASYRLAVVSNFDDAATARAVLAESGLADHFAAILISAEVGRRKPHPAIFHAALERLGCAPAEALVVGDTHAEDVIGACAAGIPVAWLAPPDAPHRDPAPTHRIASLAELPRILA